MSSNMQSGYDTSAAQTVAPQPLVAPRLPDRVFAHPAIPVPATWGGFPAMSPTSMVTPSNASTQWRRLQCPAPPERRDPRIPTSLDPTPTGSTAGPSPLAVVTPANIWPRNRAGSMDFGSTPMSSISTTSTAASENLGRRNSAPMISYQQLSTNHGLTTHLFGSQASLFSSDLTPISANGGIQSQGSSTGWMAPPVSGDATPMSVDFPSRGVSNASLNNARFIDTPQGTPVNYLDNGGSSKSKTGTSSASLGFFFAPMSEEGGLRAQQFGGA